MEYYILRKSDLQPIQKSNLTKLDLKVLSHKFLNYRMMILILLIILGGAVGGFIGKYNGERHKWEAYVDSIIVEKDSIIYALTEEKRDANLERIMSHIITSHHPMKLTKENVHDFILECDPWYPDIIYRQAILESDCGKSDVARRCNNLFGMKKPGSRNSCDINRKNKKEMYAEYSDWRLSVVDRILWDKHMFKDWDSIPTREEYLDKIRAIYNTETSDYVEKIHKVKCK